MNKCSHEVVSSKTVHWFEKEFYPCDIDAGVIKINVDSNKAIIVLQSLKPFNVISTVVYKSFCPQTKDGMFEILCKCWFMHTLIFRPHCFSVYILFTKLFLRLNKFLKYTKVKSRLQWDYDHTFCWKFWGKSAILRHSGSCNS